MKPSAKKQAYMASGVLGGGAVILVLIADIVAIVANVWPVLQVLLYPIAGAMVFGGGAWLGGTIWALWQPYRRSVQLKDGEEDIRKLRRMVLLAHGMGVTQGFVEQQRRVETLLTELRVPHPKFHTRPSRNQLFQWEEFLGQLEGYARYGRIRKALRLWDTMKEDEELAHDGEGPGPSASKLSGGG